MHSPSEQSQNFQRIHGTAIAWQDRGALFLGKPGSGKSSLALHMMALGCSLVADDQTELTLRDGKIIATCPKAINGQIEAREFGILNVDAQHSVEICCCVDLDTQETQRLPPERFKEILGQKLRLFHKPGIALLPYAVLQYLKSQQPQKPG